MPPFLGLMDDAGERIAKQPLRDLSEFNFRISPSNVDKHHLTIINAEPIVWGFDARMAVAGVALYREVDDPAPVIRTRFSSVQRPVRGEELVMAPGYLKFDLRFDGGSK